MSSTLLKRKVSSSGLRTRGALFIRNYHKHHELLKPISSQKLRQKKKKEKKNAERNNKGNENIHPTTKSTCVEGKKHPFHRSQQSHLDHMVKWSNLCRMERRRNHR